MDRLMRWAVPDGAIWNYMDTMERLQEWFHLNVEHWAVLQRWAEANAKAARGLVLR